MTRAEFLAPTGVTVGFSTTTSTSIRSPGLMAYCGRKGMTSSVPHGSGRSSDAL
jgi:hypothetical protein